MLAGELRPNIVGFVTSVERQKGLTASHLYEQLDPTAVLLKIEAKETMQISKVLCQQPPTFCFVSII